jgi:hypothetical protein
MAGVLGRVGWDAAVTCNSRGRLLEGGSRWLEVRGETERWGRGRLAAAAAAISEAAGANVAPGFRCMHQC